MRPLWPIEREVLEITAAEYPASSKAFRYQIDTARIIGFENSGAGFFSNLAVADDAPVLSETSPLSGAYGSVLDRTQHGLHRVPERRSPLNDRRLLQRQRPNDGNRFLASGVWVDAVGRETGCGAVGQVSLPFRPYRFRSLAHAGAAC